MSANQPDLREPPTPPECDLRDFPFTPVFRARLFGSSFHARANDAEWRAGFTLWLKSWDQMPAGSLPDDDIDLCRLAELGRDLKSWRKVKAMALHGWVKCSDGRLYHAVVAQGIAEAWGKRSSAKKKGVAGASKRWGTSNKTDSTGTAQDIAQAMPGDSKRSRSEVEGRELLKTEVGGNSHDSAPANAGNFGFKTSGESKTSATERSTVPHWSASEAGVAATAKLVNRPRRNNESLEDWTDAVKTLVDKRMREAAAG